MTTTETVLLASTCLLACSTTFFAIQWILCRRALMQTFDEWAKSEGIVREEIRRYFSKNPEQSTQ